jgi:hypothetical protein
MDVVAETSNLHLFLFGLAAGVGIAVVGGLIEYLLHLRRDRGPRFGVPGCLVYTIGGLILAGIVAIGISLYLTGGVAPALFVGLGVMAGFYGGFILLVSLWLLLETMRPSAAGPAASDSSLS